MNTYHRVHIQKNKVYGPLLILVKFLPYIYAKTILKSLLYNIDSGGLGLTITYAVPAISKKNQKYYFFATFFL
jgi:hypothetical protein